MLRCETRRLWIFIVLPAALLLLARPAYANAALAPTIAYLLDSFPTNMAVLAIGLPIIGLIEGWVIKNYAGKSWGDALKIAFIMNLVSIAAGLLLLFINAFFSALFSEYIFILLVIIGLPQLMRYKTGSLVQAAIVFFAIVIGIGGIVLARYSYEFGVWAIGVSLILTQVYAFGISLPIEAWAARRFMKKEDVAKTILRANVYTYILIMCVSPFFWPNPINSAGDYPSELIVDLILEGKVIQAARVTEWKKSSPAQAMGFIGLTDKDRKDIADSYFVQSKMSFMRWCRLSNRIVDEHKIKLPFVGQYIDLALVNADFDDYQRAEMQSEKFKCIMLSLTAAAVADGNPDAVRRIFVEWHDKEKAINVDWERILFIPDARSLDYIFAYCDDAEVAQDVKDEANALLAEHKEEFPRLKPIE